MRLEKQFFQSKVARRIFFLFIFSALIPVIMLAILQALQLEQQSSDKNKLEVRQESKKIGMNLLEKFAFLDSKLIWISNHSGKNDFDLIDKKESNASKFLPDFDSLTLEKNGKSSVLSGDLMTISSSYPPASHSRIMSVVHEKTVDVYFIFKPNSTYTLTGKLDKKALCKVDNKAGTLTWIIDGQDRIICQNSSAKLPQELHGRNVHSGVFDWQWDNKDYFVGYWSIFLQYYFESNNWKVVFAQPKVSYLSKAKSLVSIFLPTTMIALILSMFFSQFQIRRYLIPLEKLTGAIRRISKGKFESPLVITSGDEFEELGEAFNTMTKQLNQQFQALSLLSDLDRTILLNPDVEKVIKIISANLKNIVDYDVLVIGTMTQETQLTMKVLIDDLILKKQHMEKLLIAREDIEILRKSKKNTLSLPHKKPPPYLSRLNQLERHFIVFPISHQNHLLAVICVGFCELEAQSQCNTLTLMDIFNRISVVYTHLEWEKKLYHQAHYDDLTNLPNRFFLHIQLKKAIASAKSKRLFGVLMFIDLDNFKDINDTLGHSIGDLFLIEVASIMKNALAQRGMLARVGGDEFTILITDIKSQEKAKQIATEVAENILASLGLPIQLVNNEFRASASIGIVVYSDNGFSSTDLLRCADMSMYKAKESGKNLFVFFSDELEHVLRERNELIKDLHIAIEKEQFVLYFQPKIDSSNNQMIGAEVLLRWQHPTRGMISPNIFISLAEESNLIISLGNWVFRAVCRQIQAWQEQNIVCPPLAVNLSPKQFLYEGFEKYVQDILEETKVKSSQIEFEITEGTLISSFSKTISIMQNFNAMGISFSLDDFGTGYSSLSYLKVLPIKTIKIDQSFVINKLHDEKNINIVQAIITLASNLNLEVIAEGVETKFESELLDKMGCRIQQGYYFSYPLDNLAFRNQFLSKYSPSIVTKQY